MATPKHWRATLIISIALIGVGGSLMWLNELPLPYGFDHKVVGGLLYLLGAIIATFTSTRMKV
jgi:uncharacterized membrane protein